MLPGSPDPKFFEVLDIGRRIAGTGSLGVERFVVLVEGKGSPDGNYLLDIKEAKPSALAPHLARLGIRQPIWSDEASRVVSVQNRMQAVDHAFLQAVKLDGLPCILRGLQPSEDRVAIGEWGKDRNLILILLFINTLPVFATLKSSPKQLQEHPQSVKVVQF